MNNLDPKECYSQFVSNDPLLKEELVEFLKCLALSFIYFLEVKWCCVCLVICGPNYLFLFGGTWLVILDGFELLPVR